MSSSKHAIRTETDFGPWASQADRAALRSDERRPMTPEEYERFLAQFPVTPEVLRQRKGPRGEPFRL